MSQISPEEEPSFYTDPYSLVDSRISGRHLEVFIGNSDVSDAVRSSTFSNAINSRPKASLSMHASHPMVVNADWRGKVSVARITDGQIWPLFTGNVVSVKAEEDFVFLECDGATALIESRAGAYITSKDSGLDLIYAAARESGLRQDMISIDIPNEILETFEVIVPIMGLTKPEFDHQIGNVVLTSKRSITTTIDLIDNEKFGSRFRSASAFAVTYQTASRMYDAEQRALGDISTSLAWLTTRSQYSLATLPNGIVPAWSRKSILARIAVDAAVFVRGLTSRRMWIRELSAGTRSEDLEIDDSLRTLPETGLKRFTARVRQSLLSYQRAIRDDDPASRATLMWEALEFYAGETKVPRLFSKSEIRDIRRVLPTDLPAEKMARLEQMIGNLNSAPLLARLRVQLARDSVPLKEAEFDNLHKLRGLRNSLVHGRDASAEHLVDEIDQGLALVARILLHATRE
ncbi:hypothetical protein AB0878_33135 [Amycolatopsis sp. NPDC047767]|uniref:hypothetical protein n=1 Tax=Amycolatopsis sp. NPDC047767 TaxID=3156765 RepID=UPI00345435F0